MASSETEQEYTTPKLPLFSVPTTIQSPEHPSGMVTPPLYSTLASVPFTWEEHPGKPRPCTTLITLPTTTVTATTAALEPPPRLYIDTTKQPGIKTPSPNTVLDGPYITSSSNRHKFTSSSFSLFRSDRRRQPSFDDSSENKSPERGLLMNGDGKKKKLQKRKGLFNGWGQRNSKNGKKEIIIGASFSSFVFPASMVDGSGGGGGGSGDERNYTSLNDARIRRNGSFSSLSHAKPHFWASVYEGFKQVIPWKKSSRKTRKEQGLVL